MSLVLEITQQNGLVVRQPLDPNSAKIAAQPGDKLRILDAATGQPAGDLVARRVGDALVVEQAGGATVELTEFFAQCAPGEGCELVLEDGDKTTTITQATEPMSVAADGTPVMYDGALAAQAGSAPAQEGAAAAAGSAGAAEGGAAGAGAAAGGVSTGAILAGVGAVGLAAAAGGGGSGGGGTPPADNPPEAPAIEPVAGGDGVDATEAAAGVTVSGTAEAGSTVTVVWSGAGGESYTKTATADANGAWSVAFPVDEVPEDGTTTITATASNAAGDSAPSTVDVTVDTAAAVDTTPPDAPVIDAVTGDNTIDTTEATNGFAVSGIAEAGSNVAVTIAGTAISKTATADASGAWSVDIAPGEVPADGNYTISATATDAAGNVSAAGTSDVTIAASVPDTTPPEQPVITEVGTAGVVNAAALATGVVVSGTAEGGSTVDVTWGALTAQAVAAGDGTWSTSFTPGASDPAAEITATATDAAGNPSPASAPSSITVDVTPPIAPTIDAVEGDNVIDPIEAADGVVISGTGEDGSLITVMWGGIEKTATVAGNVWSVDYASDEIPSGATTVTATATDAAGNPQSEPPVTQSVVVDSGTATQIGGAGDQIIVGGGGDDVLIGDSGGSIRNYQFDYWNIDGGQYGGGGVAGTGIDSWAGIVPGATGLGWTVLGASTFAEGTPDADATLVNGGWVELRGNSLPVGGEDPTATGGTHLWDSVYEADDSGSGIGQSIATSAGETYTLSIQAASYTGAAVEIWWDNSLIAYFNGTTGAVDPVDPNNWNGPVPMAPGAVDGSLGDRVTYSFDVVATGAETALEIRTFDTATNDGYGFFVDRVTLTAASTDGNDTIDGGAGNDLIFGQGGNDTLTGGADADTFVFSMRTDNGNDVITDFEVGVDRIMLIDAIDAQTAGSVAPHPATGPNSDANLTFEDFLGTGNLGEFASQAIGLSEVGGNLVLTFTGADNTPLGSVTLEGITISEYPNVPSLFNGNIIDVTGDGFHAGLNNVI